jgi:hypothetical protein
VQGRGGHGKHREHEEGGKGVLHGHHYSRVRGPGSTQFDLALDTEYAPDAASNQL